MTAKNIKPFIPEDLSVTSSQFAGRSGLRVMPAMAAGLTGAVWTLEELAGLLEPKAKAAAA